MERSIDAVHMTPVAISHPTKIGLVPLSTAMATCCLCLGGDTDIPAFGTIKDAQDLITPCAQCLIVTHRKCLLEWFNSLPTDKIKVVDVRLVSSDTSLAPTAETHEDLNIGVAPLASDSLALNTSSLTMWVMEWARMNSDIDMDMGYAGNDEQDLEVPLTHRVSPHVFLMTSCPQCKSEIVFSLKRLPFLSFLTNMRVFATKFVQYGGLFLGFTLAVTGVVTMGYVGLTTCGLKIMESLVPGNLIVKLLTRGTPQSNYQNLSQLLLGRSDTHGIDNLEQALVKGLVDPLKFSRVPVLPIVLYRMRLSSISSVLFGNSQDNPYPWNAFFTEFMISAYLSSLGNHELAYGVYRNVVQMFKHPHRGTTLLQGINLWKTTNMISMLVPVRWIYDLVYRVTVNRKYFDLTLRVRPRDIANSMSQDDVDKLEDINNALGSLALRYYVLLKQINSTMPNKGYGLSAWLTYFKRKLMVTTKLANEGFYSKLLKLKLMSALYLLRATIRYDYSRKVGPSLVALKWIGTVVWPLVSLKVGGMLFKYIAQRLSHIPQDKVMMLLNFIGLLLVVIVRDILALGINYHKASQLLNLTVLCRDHTSSTTEEVHELQEEQLPGTFQSGLY